MLLIVSLTVSSICRTIFFRTISLIGITEPHSLEGTFSLTVTLIQASRIGMWVGLVILAISFGLFIYERRKACSALSDNPPPMSPNEDNAAGRPILYAMFPERLAAILLDLLVVAAVSWLCALLNNDSRVFTIGSVLFLLAFELFYEIYLVGRYGATPGKLIVGLKITQMDFSPITYRQAILRFLPYLVFRLFIAAQSLWALLLVSNAEYAAATFTDWPNKESELTPFWFEWIGIACSVWLVIDFAVFLGSRKRRALHDYIAGTVVLVNKPQNNVA